ncbi:MAG: NADH:ubiquinone reductase (Na(+)-transporting) subunit C [Saprospiraceae bacterium]|nr:NADH:ubiquinone reductase (Na(+)-transporting) subunit C [Saprospiraceae bacterium]
MFSTSYIIKFTLIMTVIVSLVLSLLVSGLKDVHSENESVYNKKGILSAVSAQLGKDLNTMTNTEVQEVFSSKITQKVINMKGEELTPDQIKKLTGVSTAVEIDLGKENKKPVAERVLPVFTFKDDKNKEYNILYVRGKGLWDEIWGYIAMDSDWNSIAGQAFDHKGETPGLGAEIKDNKAWYKQFTGRKLYDSNGNFKSVSVVKGGIKVPDHQVDAISGATITGNGVDEMMKRGLKYYEPYILKNKKS